MNQILLYLTTDCFAVVSVLCLEIIRHFLLVTPGCDLGSNVT